MTSKSLTDFSKVELDCRSGSEVEPSATVVGDTASDIVPNIMPACRQSIILRIAIIFLKA